MIRRSVVSAICPSQPYVVSTKMCFDQLSFDEVLYTPLRVTIGDNAVNKVIMWWLSLVMFCDCDVSWTSSLLFFHCFVFSLFCDAFSLTFNNLMLKVLLHQNCGLKRCLAVIALGWPDMEHAISWLCLEEFNFQNSLLTNMHTV